MFYVSGWLLCCLAPTQLPAVLPWLNSSHAPVASSFSSSIVQEGGGQGVSDDSGAGVQWEATDAAVVVCLLLGSRALIGVALGFVCTSVAGYQTELAPTSIRGAIGLCLCLVTSCYMHTYIRIFDAQLNPELNPVCEAFIVCALRCSTKP